MDYNTLTLRARIDRKSGAGNTTITSEGWEQRGGTRGLGTKWRKARVESSVVERKGWEQAVLLHTTFVP